MKFKSVCIDGISFGDDIDMTYEELESYYKPIISNVDFGDKTFFNILNDSNNPMQIKIINFLKALTLCHTAVTYHENVKVKYNTSSPDEFAFLNFARLNGFLYLDIDNKERKAINIKYKMNKKIYEE